MPSWPSCMRRACYDRPTETCRHSRRVPTAGAATGSREWETIALVSPATRPAPAAADDLAAELHTSPNIAFSALVASPNGANRAIAAALRSIEYVVSAADGHSPANVG